MNDKNKDNDDNKPELRERREVGIRNGRIETLGTIKISEKEHDDNGQKLDGPGFDDIDENDHDDGKVEEEVDSDKIITK